MNVRKYFHPLFVLVAIASIGAPCGGLKDSGDNSPLGGDVCVGGNCVCAEGEDCDLSCDTPDGQCNAECAATSSCAVDCGESAQCNVQCANGGTCDMACGTSNQCNLQCAASDDCSADCGSATNCQVQCTDATACDVDCSTAGRCVVQCPTSGCTVNNCNMMGGMCVVTCGNGGLPTTQGDSVVCR